MAASRDLSDGRRLRGDGGKRSAIIPTCEQVGPPADLAEVPGALHAEPAGQTFAVRALRAGANVVGVSKLLGHSALTTTMRYVDHLGLGELRQAVAPLPVEQLRLFNTEGGDR